MFQITLNNIKNKFNDIKILRENIIEISNIINEKLVYLNDMYKELINNRYSILLTNCLDSFHFQKKILNYEFESNKKLIKMIECRIYGDYYKLFKYVLNFSTNVVKDSNKIKPSYIDKTSEGINTIKIHE